MSSQPVAPSFGIRSSTGTLAAFSVFVWYGQDAPIVASPFLNRLISSEASPQYFLIERPLLLQQADRRVELLLVQLVGILDPERRLRLHRYSAASAIWIGLFGTVILPLNFGL